MGYKEPKVDDVVSNKMHGTVENIKKAKKERKISKYLYVWGKKMEKE